MTLTFSGIARARLVIFTVAGEDKREAFAARAPGRPDLPAARVRADRVDLAGRPRAAADVGAMPDSARSRPSGTQIERQRALGGTSGEELVARAPGRRRQDGAETGAVDRTSVRAGVRHRSTSRGTLPGDRSRGRGSGDRHTSGRVDRVEPSPHRADRRR